MVDRREIEDLVRKHVEEELRSADYKEYIVAANWKMNMSAKETEEFLEDMRRQEIEPYLKAVIFPPYPYLHIFQEKLKHSEIRYGAQDIAKEEKGAYTGEVSASMLTDMGCSYTLTGHSERRSYYGETPEIAAKKTAAALKGHITPILCIGETLKERREGRYKQILKGQLDAVAAELGERLKDCIVAYEPVWAIGTGIIPKMSEIREAHKYIREVLGSYGNGCGKNVKILYGGSVNEKNVTDIASAGYVDGFLIGGASLKAESYSRILELLQCHFC